MTALTYEPSAESAMIYRLRQALHGLMTVEDVTVLENGAYPTVRFGGLLTSGDQNDRFEEIVTRFATHGYTPMLEGDAEIHRLTAIPGVPDGRTGKVWVNAVLFVLTALAVLLTGALNEMGMEGRFDLWRGVPFAATLLGILIFHEFSHYFVGRRHGSPVSLPYFIPLPVLSFLGTMGAVIVQRGPMRSRKALFDIGAAGPIGGLIIAIPLLFIGLAYSEVGSPDMFIDVPEGQPLLLLQEGNSLLYLGAKYAIHGRVLPDPHTGEDVWLSAPSVGGPMAFAAWAGLLVTMLNLSPIGQLDGGHVAYAMWGRRAWLVARAYLLLLFGWGGLLLFLGNMAGVTWVVWGMLGSLLGPRHPPPLNDLTPLDGRRRLLGWILILIYVLIFIPIPLIEVTL